VTAGNAKKWEKTQTTLRIMNKSSKLTPVRFIAALAVGLAASTASSHAQSTLATISAVPAAGDDVDYTILLTDTGSQSLNSFWYGWTTSGNNLPSDPSSAGNSLGWANDLDGNSIQWVNSTGTALGAGQTATFTFVSTSSLSAITSPPSGESVAYVGGIDFTEGQAGDSTPVFSPTIATVPEPSSVGLLAASLLVVAGSYRWWAASRQSRPTAQAAAAKSAN
jgi:hypothetical protein